MSLLTPERERMFDDVAQASREELALNRGGYYFSGGPFPYIRFHGFKELIERHLLPYMRVVDVGCGAGDKLLAFKDLDATLDVTGIEIRPTMAAFARYMAPWATIIEGNALQQNYNEYDLIYMYWPIADKHWQEVLQRLVIRRMKHGAILVVACGQGKQQNKLYQGYRKP